MFLVTTNLRGGSRICKKGGRDPKGGPGGRYRGKLGNGEHLSLKAYKYKEHNIYVLIIMQHKEHIKFYRETHFYPHHFSR